MQLLAVGTVGMLAADVLYGLIQLHGTFHNGTAVDLGWAVLYSAWGAAALHPSMTQLTDRVTVQRAEASPVRLFVLSLGALIAPTVLLIGSLRDHYSDGSVIAVFSAVLYLLVLTRLSDTAASHRRALGRERAVRRAGAALASAGSVEDAASAAEGAAAALLGPGGRPAALLAVRACGRLQAAAAGTAAPIGQLEELAAGWLRRLAGPRPAFVPVTQLGDPVPALYLGCEGALLCPLMLSDRPSGDPLIGVLAVFGRRAALTGLSGTLEVLAGQVALAMERVILSQEVTRQRSEEYFRTLVQDASEVILIVGEGDVVRYATPSAAGIFGHTQIEGAALPDLAGSAGQEEVSRALARMRDRDRRGHHEELWHVSGRDGRPVQVKVRCSDLRADSTVEGLVLTLRDVTEERRLEDQLKHQAFHDPLTGLPNRRLFADRAGRALEAARRGGYDAAVVFVDLDDFKMVNDTMGHDVGDALLEAAGSRLSGVVRETDTAARLGGDEFALLIERIADPAEADALAARVMKAFSSPFALPGRQIVTAATAGVATTRDSGDADELLRHADMALYAAKSAGKRQWRRYQPALAAGMNRRQEVRSALDLALSGSAFTLAYQPIVELDTGEIAGFEALVRWPHPDWGMMLPGEFIALAEETGHIVALGEWVLRQAAADMARWRAHASQDSPYVSVNVSARQFLSPGFAGTVADALASSGLDPRALTLELTESALLDPDDRVNNILNEVKRAGVRLAIDDFGTGYSTLSYLRELPIDVLKIDKSFLDGVTASPRQRVLVEGIIAIASGLSLQVIAEGIETQEQRETLVAAGCRYGQGFLLAKPVGPDQAAELIRRRQQLVPGLAR